ncbi:hypothetical protein ASD19_12620 [Microbacterium sp. Root53]|nr:hypothetical protein ASD19_12620 [Microbacterium sp. Root53]
MRDAPAVRIAAIYVAARVITTAFFLLGSAMAPADSRFGPGADLGTYLQAWDAQYYRRIAIEGYPVVLPLTDDGEVAQNAWAFMPLFAWAAGALGAVLGGWGAGAGVIALVSGYLCCLVLRRMLVERIGERAAMWAVAFFAAAPLAAMFQVGYAEAPFLLLILLGIRCLQRREYAWLFAIVPVMAFTRPGVLAFALLLGLFGAWRWLCRRREPLARGELIRLAGAAALAVGLGFGWQLIAGAVTGRMDAYLETELSWRRLWVGDTGPFVPFEGWLLAIDYWFGQWGLDPAWGLAGLVVAVVGVGLVLALDPRVPRLGVEARLWAASYLLYLLAVFLPQSSVFRLLFPLAPLWGAVAQPRSLAWRLGVLAACLAGQWWWIWCMYGLGTEFWHIP